jgi:hypothetical protein
MTVQDMPERAYPRCRRCGRYLEGVVSQAIAQVVHAKCTVIKVHGDYLDARIKNTDAELEAYSPAMNGLLDQVFDNFGLLVVGWSGEWDTALRDAIQRAPSRRYANRSVRPEKPRPVA